MTQPVPAGSPVLFKKTFCQNGKLRAEAGEVGEVEFVDWHGSLGWVHVVVMPTGHRAVLHNGNGFPHDETRFTLPQKTLFERGKDDFSREEDGLALHGAHGQG
jgi:hypothetical protein